MACVLLFGYTVNIVYQLKDTLIMNNNKSPFMSMKDNPMIHIGCPSCSYDDEPMHIDEIETMVSHLFGVYAILFDIHSTCKRCGCTANYAHTIHVEQSILAPISYTDKWSQALDEIGDE